MNIKVAKRPTQRDVAQLAGVSQGVVSVVLNNAPGIRLVLPETRQKVLQAARTLKYRVNIGARQLRLGSSNLVNILIPAQFSRLLRNLVDLLEELLAARQFRVMVSKLDVCNPHIFDDIQSIMASDYAGAIILDHFVPENLAAPDYAVSNVLQQYPHSIFLSHAPNLIPGNCVSINHASGVCEAVAALHAAGRRRFALVLNDNFRLPMRERLDGFRAGLARCGIPAGESILWVASENNLSGLEGAMPETIAPLVAEEVIGKQKPDALIASNDEWAISIIKVLRRKRIRVPDDIAVVGYGDDHDLCWCCDPELASINHGNAELAAKLVERLLVNLNDPDADPRHYEVVNSYYVDRESSGIVPPVR